MMQPDELKTIAKSCLGRVRMRYPKYRKYLDGVKFIIREDMATNAAEANHESGHINLNMQILCHPLNEGGIEDTVLHELAHIIANRLATANVNHSVIWRSVCKKIGGSGRKNHTFTVPMELQERERMQQVELTCPMCKENRISLDPRRAMKMLMGVCGYLCGDCGSKQRR